MIEMEPTPAMTIERARPEDAEAMVAVQAQTWMATYPNEAAGISKAAIRRRIYGEHNEKIGPRIERYRQRISHPDDTHAEFVARSNGQVVGFVHAGLDSKQRRQIQALYVLPHTQGKGVGSGLLRAALDWHGNHDVYLTVTTYNERAIAFYRQHSFVETGQPVKDEIAQPGDVELPELEMKRPARTTK